MVSTIPNFSSVAQEAVFFFLSVSPPFWADASPSHLPIASFFLLQASTLGGVLLLWSNQEATEKQK